MFFAKRSWLYFFEELPIDKEIYIVIIERLIRDSTKR